MVELKSKVIGKCQAILEISYRILVKWMYLCRFL